MTNEKAIHIIDVAFDIPRAVRRSGEDRTYHEAEIREAKDMAIKALSCSENPNRCEDAISRSDAIRVASGYCHWSNIPKELAKLPSVNPIPCEDAISRQAVIKGLTSLAKARAKSDAQKSMMGRAMLFVERLPSVSMEKPNRCGDLISREETLTAFADYVGSGMSMNDYDALWDIVAKMPSVKTQEPCKDTISRQAAIRLAEQGQVQGFEWQLKELVKLPSVSTEKTGRWYLYEMFANGETILECSVCHNKHDKPWKYCPSCGAKMEAEE